MKDIRLRPIEREDLDILHKWRNDSNIFSQLGGGYFPVSKTEMSKWMDNFCKLDKKNIRLIIQYESKPVGFISLTSINYINKNANLGIYIGESDYRGKGIASKSLNELEVFAREHLDIKKIKLLVNSNNLSAINLYLKNKYQKVGVLREERLIDNKWIDVNVMEKIIQ